MNFIDNSTQNYSTNIQNSTNNNNNNNNNNSIKIIVIHFQSYIDTNTN